MSGDAGALKVLRREVYSETARKSTEARIEWWLRRAAKRGLSPFPLDTASLQLAGALLKQGRYRSAAQCLYA